MSELPTISAESLYKRLYATLSAKDTETQRHTAHLELLAEALRDERDVLQGEVEALQKQIKAQPHPHPDVVEGVITDVSTPSP